jgi:hypothetical protein
VVRFPETDPLIKSARPEFQIAESRRNASKVSLRSHLNRIKNSKRLAAALRRSLHRFTLSERFSTDVCDHRVTGDVQAEKHKNGTISEHDPDVNPTRSVVVV